VLPLALVLIQVDLHCYLHGSFISVGLGLQVREVSLHVALDPLAIDKSIEVFVDVRHAQLAHFEEDLTIILVVIPSRAYTKQVNFLFCLLLLDGFLLSSLQPRKNGSLAI